MKLLRYKNQVLIVLTVLSITACSKGNSDSTNDLSAKIVVEGYVFANEPVEGIHISQVNASGSSELIPVTDAEVEIAQGGSQVQLIDSTGSSGTYSQNQSSNYLLPDTGDIQLRVVLAGNTYTSHVSFPSKLNGLNISNSQVNLISGNSTQTVATLSWYPVANATGYCIFIRNLSDNANPIIEANGQTSVFHKLIYNTSIDLKSTDFIYAGDYDIYVTAVNQEYASMYSNSDSNNLISGFSNIENGWGIFTAFNGMAVSVSVQ